MEKKTITYTSPDMNELFELADINGMVDTDKLYDWLLKSEFLEYDDEVKSKITKKARERKLNKLNKNERENNG